MIVIMRGIHTPYVSLCGMTPNPRLCAWQKLCDVKSKHFQHPNVVNLFPRKVHGTAKCADIDKCVIHYFGASCKFDLITSARHEKKKNNN